MPFQRKAAFVVVRFYFDYDIQMRFLGFARINVSIYNFSKTEINRIYK